MDETNYLKNTSKAALYQAIIEYITERENILNQKPIHYDNPIHYDKPIDYGNDLKPILTSDRIAYVISNKTNNHIYDKETLNVQKLKEEYNPDRRNSWKLQKLTKMVTNQIDMEVGYCIYPFPFENLYNFYKKRKINSKAYLIETKYHYWDLRDIDIKELYEKYNYEINKRISSNYFSTQIIQYKCSLGPLKPDLKIPLNPFDLFRRNCKLVFIVIESDNGLTVFTYPFSILFMPGFIKKDNKLEVISCYGNEYKNYGQQKAKNQSNKNKNKNKKNKNKKRKNRK